MKLSARNILPATVKTVTPGAVDTEVVVELAPGIEIFMPSLGLSGTPTGKGKREGVWKNCQCGVRRERGRRPVCGG
jgi:hypothetical protein